MSNIYNYLFILTLIVFVIGFAKSSTKQYEIKNMHISIIIALICGMAFYLTTYYLDGVPNGETPGRYMFMGGFASCLAFIIMSIGNKIR